MRETLLMLKKMLMLSMIFGIYGNVYGEKPSAEATHTNAQNNTSSGNINGEGFSPGQKLPMAWASIPWDQAVTLSGDDAATLKRRVQGVYQSSSFDKQNIEKTYPAQIEGLLKFYNGDPKGHNADKYRKDIGRRIVILMTVQGKSPILKDALVIKELSVKTPIEELAKAAGITIQAAQDIIDTYAKKKGVKDEKSKKKIRDYLNGAIQMYQNQRLDTSLEDSSRIRATKELARSILNLLSVEKTQVS